MKTFIRRPGNKTNFLKHIIPRIPDFPGTYYEPFLGTGAVYLYLLPKKAVLNDLNKDIANVWKLIKKNPEYLLREISEFKKTFLPLNNEEKLKVCKEITKSLNSLNSLNSLKGDKKTVMYLLMLYCSFNSSLEHKGEYRIEGLYTQLYIHNSAHIFTEKFQEKLRVLSKILQKVKVYSKDYSEVISEAKEGDFVFLDPPYVEEKSYRFNYVKKEQLFSNTNLLSCLNDLTSRKVKWMMTQIDTLEVRELFKKYSIVEYENSNGIIGRLSKKELIITNY